MKTHGENLAKYGRGILLQTDSYFPCSLVCLVHKFSLEGKSADDVREEFGNKHDGKSDRFRVRNLELGCGYTVKLAMEL